MKKSKKAKSLELAQPTETPAASVSVQKEKILSPEDSNEKYEMIQNEDGTFTARLTPSAMLDEAEGEPNRRDLADYRAVIIRLRSKGFNFREIAEWLLERDVYADHNAVYRVYSKYMTMDEAVLEDELEKEDQQRALEDS